jgi:hypothetical protein
LTQGLTWGKARVTIQKDQLKLIQIKKKKIQSNIALTRKKISKQRRFDKK